MDTATAAFCAGFWDGEGWAVIGIEYGKEGRSDIHHAGIYATQRVRHRAVLDYLHVAFGGTISIRDTRLSKGSENWAEQANWHIHTRPEIERFCRAVQPYCLVKAAQVAIMLEYVTGFEVSPNLRDDLGRIRGRSLSAEEVARRERLRLALKVANATGPERTVKIEHPRRSAFRIARSRDDLAANPKTLSRGERRPLARLTETGVRAIRSAHAAGGVTMDALAVQYGVSPAAIRQVIRRLSWQHVE